MWTLKYNWTHRTSLRSLEYAFHCGRTLAHQVSFGEGRPVVIMVIVITTYIDFVLYILLDSDTVAVVPLFLQPRLIVVPLVLTLSLVGNSFGGKLIGMIGSRSSG